MALDVDSDTDIIIAEDEDEQPEEQQRYTSFKFCDDSKKYCWEFRDTVSPEYEADTDYESDSTSWANWPPLPDFFDGLVFALHEQLPDTVRRKLRRYIVSAKGYAQ